MNLKWEVVGKVVSELVVPFGKGDVFPECVKTLEFQAPPARKDAALGRKIH